MLKIRAFFAWLIHYRLPYYYQKYISHTTITEKGEKLFLYCADIIAEKREPKDYTEVMLEEQIQKIRIAHQWSRDQCARYIFLQLLTFQPISFKDFWALIKHK